MITVSRIKFGPYQWLILEEQVDRYLLLTESMIEQRDYHTDSHPTTWENCALRQYLNQNFYQQFSLSEQARIIEVSNQNTDNPWYQTTGGNDTSDKIFLLSLDEVVRYYFGDSGSLLDFPSPKQRYWFQRKDPNNSKRRAQFLDAPWWWWLRTPGKNQRTAIYIHGDGNVGIQGNGIGSRQVNVIHPFSNETRGGVRPALWIKK